VAAPYEVWQSYAPTFIVGAFGKMRKSLLGQREPDYLGLIALFSRSGDLRSPVRQARYLGTPPAHSAAAVSRLWTVHRGRPAVRPSTRTLASESIASHTVSSMATECWSSCTLVAPATFSIPTRRTATIKRSCDSCRCGPLPDQAGSRNSLALARAALPVCDSAFWVQLLHITR
jgi:hypothetical protein